MSQAFGHLTLSSGQASRAKWVRPQWAESTLVRPDRSDAGDVCGQEVDAVSVEAGAGAVVALGGSGVVLAGEDLGVAEGDAGIEGVGGGKPQGVRADMPWAASSFRDPCDHAVGVASVDRRGAGDIRDLGRTHRPSVRVESRRR